MDVLIECGTVSMWRSPIAASEDRNTIVWSSRVGAVVWRSPIAASEDRNTDLTPRLQGFNGGWRSIAASEDRNDSVQPMSVVARLSFCAGCPTR